VKEFINKITVGECAELMNRFPDNCIDLTVTSPPYDKMRDYKGYSFDFETIASELFRVTKEGGVVVWVAGDQAVNGSESLTSFKQAIYFKEIGFNVHDTMIYEKAAPAAPSNNRYFQVFEYMFVLSKGRPATYNLIEDRKNIWDKSFGDRSIRNKDGKLIRKGKYIQKNKYGRRFNIWRYATGKRFTTKDEYAFEHPAMFPEKLARDHILSWSNPGNVVLDPMCGSGTTCKMAKINGRDFIGLEIAEEYAKIARKRVAGVQAMHPLFQQNG